MHLGEELVEEEVVLLGDDQVELRRVVRSRQHHEHHVRQLQYWTHPGQSAARAGHIQDSQLHALGTPKKVSCMRWTHLTQSTEYIEHTFC